jgi:3-dehydroquinate synthetase
LSCAKGYIAAEDVEYIKRTLLDAGLPVIIPDFSIDSIIRLLSSDKKSNHGTVYYSLLKGLGKATYNETADDILVRDILAKYSS